MSAGSPRKDSAVVLVADDEPTICNLLRQILEREGYCVLIAMSTTKALAVARAFSKPIDLLIADIEIPKASGVGIACELLAERPEMHVLLMSRGAPGDLLKFPCISKPFDIHAFRAKVKEVLDAAA